MTQETPAVPTPPVDQTPPAADLKPAAPKGVVLDDDEVTKKIALYTEGAYAVIITNPKAAFLAEKAPDAKGIRDYIPYLIKEWNFITKAGDPVPITLETVGKLSIQDQYIIMDALGFARLLLSDAKKNS